MTPIETSPEKPTRQKAAAKKKTKKSARRTPRRAAKPAPPPGPPPVKLDLRLPKFRPGADYQVAHDGRLINGRKYKAGAILDQTGIAQRDIEIWRELRHIIDIPASGPLMPIPDEETPAPLTAKEREHITKRDDKPEGRVTPKHRGFNKWYCVDGSNKNIAGPFEGDTARVRCLKRCIELNDENEHPVTDEERAEAAITFNENDGHGR